MPPGQPLTVGRSRDADVTIDDGKISRRHISLLAKADGALIRDLGSQNGTYIDSERIEERLVRPGAAVRLGDTEITIEALQPIAARVQEYPTGTRIFIVSGAGRETQLAAQTPITIGRGSEADIRVDDKRLSRLHLRIWIENGEVHVRDLGSSNGTFLGGLRIDDAIWPANQPLTAGHTQFLLRTTGPPSAPPMRPPEQASIDAGTPTFAHIPSEKVEQRAAADSLPLARSPTYRADPNKLKLFISYSRSDATAARAIAKYLERGGFEVEIDSRDLPYGEVWKTELSRMIRAADTIVYLVSPSSIASSWCKWELEQVKRVQKRLLPVVLRAVPQEALPGELRDVQMLPSIGAFDTEKHFGLLCDVLNTNFTWVKEHSRLLDRASEWKLSGRTSDLLLRGGALSAAETWLKNRPRTESVPNDIIRLIEASRGQRLRQRIAIAGASLALMGTLAGGWFLLELFIHRMDNYVKERIANAPAELVELRERVAERDKLSKDAVAAVERARRAIEISRTQAERQRLEAELQRAQAERARAEEERARAVAEAKAAQDVAEAAARRNEPPHPPSFDCAKDRNPDEQMICRSPLLSRLDVELAGVYEALKMRMTGASFDAVRASQRAFLLQRRTCNDPRCIESIYRQRIQQLQELMRQI